MLLGDGLLGEWGASSSAFAITCRIEVLGKILSTLDRITACNPSKHKQPTAQQPHWGGKARGRRSSLFIYLSLVSTIYASTVRLDGLACTSSACAIASFGVVVSMVTAGVSSPVERSSNWLRTTAAGVAACIYRLPRTGPAGL